MQALPATAESLCIVEMGGVETGDKVVGGGLFLNIGLNVRCHVLFYILPCLSLTLFL